MKLWAFLFFFAVSNVLADIDRQRDGLVVMTDAADVSVTYHSVRWEPLCGTVTAASGNLDQGTNCISAMNEYTNDTVTTLAFYDFSGVKLINAGVGLGKELCLCFSMSTVAAAAYNICWAYDAIGQVMTDGGGWPITSYRPGASKTLPQCGSVNVDALQASWSLTAVMPQATGPILTLNTDTAPVTVDHTVIQTSVETSTLTPTLVNLTISSSAVVTGPDGQLTTEDRSYTTTAAVINFEPAPQQGLTPGDKIALGIGLGLGLPTFVLGVLGFYYNRRQKAAASAGSASNGVVSRRMLQYGYKA